MEKKHQVKFGYLYKMAWTFEILAALTGLTIALTTALQGEDFSVAVLPLTLTFALVAVAELTKIPLITVALNANKMAWKLFFTFATVLLMVITFETMVNGLSNGAAYQTQEIIKVDETILENRSNVAIQVENLKALEDSVVGGKIETNLKDERTKIEERLATFSCETTTQSRTWYTGFLGKRTNIHVNEACANEQAKQQARLDQTQSQLDGIKSGAWKVQEAINVASADIDASKQTIKVLSKEKADLARTNNIYTMAFTMIGAVDKIYGIEREEELISASQLTQADVNRTIQIFFGILAFVVACTGPFLAAAFTVLNHENGTLIRKVIYDARGNVTSDNQTRTLASFSGDDNKGTF